MRPQIKKKIENQLLWEFESLKRGRYGATLIYRKNQGRCQLREIGGGGVKLKSGGQSFFIIPELD